MKTLRILLAATALLGLAGTAAQAGSHGQKPNIVETAAAAGQFETLIAAAKAAGLAGALSGDGPLTVFAPTDEAFGALPAGTIETLLKPENKDTLARILKFHVIGARVGSGALADGAQLDTLAGVRSEITAAEKGFTINGARIISTDIDASNGVVHVIDRVIMPPETMSRTAAAQSIMGAIEKGVPMFNHGNAAGTVKVYADTARMLVSSADLTDDERQRLMRGLSAADSAHGASDSAWQLRYALDDVVETLMASGSDRRAMNR